MQYTENVQSEIDQSNNQPLVIGLFADWGYWYPKT